MTEKTAYQRWYEKNKDKLSEKRKKRYREDPEYRQGYLDRKAKQTEALRAEPVDPKYTHNFTEAAEALGVTLWTLRSWRSKDLIPEPHVHNKGLYFTTAQVGLLTRLRDFYKKVGKPVLTEAEQNEVEQISDLIRANWE